MIDYLGFWLLAVMTLNMWALTYVVQSGASLTKRLIWGVALLIPVLGFFAWFLFGPRARA
ncbi:unnamed protein product [Ectocarpus sp. 12 AP-2014]